MAAADDHLTRALHNHPVTEAKRQLLSSHSARSGGTVRPIRRDRGALLRDHLCALHDGTRLEAVQPPTHALLRHMMAHDANRKHSRKGVKSKSGLRFQISDFRLPQGREIVNVSFISISGFDYRRAFLENLRQT